MNEALYYGQKMGFSVSMPQALYDRMEEARGNEPFKISRAAFVAGLIEKGLDLYEEANSNPDTHE